MLGLNAYIHLLQSHSAYSTSIGPCTSALDVRWPCIWPCVWPRWPCAGRALAVRSNARKMCVLEKMRRRCEVQTTPRGAGRLVMGNEQFWIHFPPTRPRKVRPRRNPCFPWKVWTQLRSVRISFPRNMRFRLNGFRRFGFAVPAPAPARA